MRRLSNFENYADCSFPFSIDMNGDLQIPEIWKKIEDLRLAKS